MLNQLSKLYGWIVERRNRAFDTGTHALIRVSVPVISVGNLTTGGTGKTPVVQEVVRMIQSLGHAPAVVMRGYNRASKGLKVVHDGTGIRGTVMESGDEAWMHAAELSVPVVVCNDKAEAARYAAAELPCDCIVVDDGFQHRHLYRDVNIVLVDANTLHDTLLPAGHLREPIRNIARANVVLCSNGVGADVVREYCTPDTLFSTVDFIAQLSELQGKRVICVSGIANPERFENSVANNGAEIVKIVRYPDHHWYNKGEADTLLQYAVSHKAAIVTTHKDAVKLAKAEKMFRDSGIEYLVLPVAARIEKQRELKNLIASHFNNYTQHENCNQ